MGLRHAAVAQALDAVRLTAVVEPDPERAAMLVQDGLPVVLTLDAVPGDTRAAIIATPTPDHRPSTEAAFARGLAVLVEKPIAGTLDDGRAMQAAAERVALPLIIGHHRRCHPFSLAARTRIEALGALVGVQGLWSVRKHDRYYDPAWRRAPVAGPLLTNLSHEIDLLRFLVGEITEVTALTSSARRGFDIEDTAALAFRFAGGAMGSYLVSDAGASPWSFESASHENPSIAGSDQDYLRFVGTEGALAFPSLAGWERSGPGEIEWSKPLAPMPVESLPVVDPIAEQMSRFARIVDGGSDTLLCNAVDGIAALEGTLAAALSARLSRPVVIGTLQENLPVYN